MNQLYDFLFRLQYNWDLYQIHAFWLRKGKIAFIQTENKHLWVAVMLPINVLEVLKILLYLSHSLKATDLTTDTKY